MITDLAYKQRCRISQIGVNLEDRAAGRRVVQAEKVRPKVDDDAILSRPLVKDESSISHVYALQDLLIVHDKILLNSLVAVLHAFSHPESASGPVPLSR